MNRLSTKAFVVWTALAFGAIGLSRASAAPLSRDEQACISAFTTSVAKVGKAQGGIVRDCLKRFAAGSLVAVTPEACMITDRDTKLRKAAFKTDSAAYFACAAVDPEFGVSASPAAIVMAAGKDIELVRRILGPNLNTALVPLANEARCQVRVSTALQKCADTRMVEYTKCLRSGMKKGTIVDAATLQATCLGADGQTQPDPRGRIAKQCVAKVAKEIDRYCDDVDIARAFSPCKTGDAPGLVSCVTRESACKLCQVVNSVNRLSQDCDSFDNGDMTDGTCGDECADGIVQSGEGCDDGNTDDGDGCTNDCKIEVGWGCTGEPSECSLNCGNGTLDADEGEECDDGNSVGGDGCSSSCEIEACANGRLDVGETCDDENHANDDGCSNACQTEPGYLCSGQPSVCTFVCGNGTFDPGENCDDGNRVEGDGCSGVCKVESGYACNGQPSVCSGVCGDGLLRPGEGCDDGNTTNTDGCANSCQAETGYQCSGEPSVCTSVCGDGIMRKQETCDDGNTDAGDGCSSDCALEPGWACLGQPSVCGPACSNGRLDAGEECDDGNLASGDGCGPCTIEAGFACAGQPSMCSPTCSNGRVELALGEQCDDGNITNGDGCSSGCLIESGYACVAEPSQCAHTCGNALIQPGIGEQCDDGNRTAGDGCGPTCLVEFAYSCTGQPSNCALTCGNGQINTASFEQCDDGNTVGGDGCNEACLTEPGWYCAGAPSSCEPFRVFIDSPAHGTFSDAATVTITGHYTALPANHAGILINGAAPNLSWNPEDRTFKHIVTLNKPALLNPVSAIAVNTATGDDVRARIVVIAGGSVADGAYSPESVALRLNESGLASMQPLIASMASSGLDIGSMMPVGRKLVSDQCFVDVGFLGCWGRASVSIASPAPSISGVGLVTDSRPDVVHGDISINNLRIDITINGSGLVPSCGLRLSANRLTLGGNFALEPAAVNPSHVDVDLVGPMSVAFTGFNNKFTWGICTWPIIGDIIGALLPNVENMATGSMNDFLGDPDGAGPRKSPVAEGIESALDGVNISGSVGEGVGMTFEAPMFKIEEDNSGITLGAHSRFNVSIGTGLGQCTPPPGTPNLTASYSKYEPFPAFGATSPVRGVPYGLGIAISTSGFNQLLRGQTECGLMRSSLTEIDLDGPDGAPAATITSDLLSVFVPEFAFLPPGTELRIDLAPTIAPMVTGNLGPNGEIAELLIAQLGIEIVDVDTGIVWLRGAFDARLGMDLAFKPDGSGLAITINKPAIDDLTIRVIDNPLGANEESVETVLPNIMAPMIPSLAGALSGFPLPQFFGLQLQGVEVSRNGQFLSLFANLVVGG